MKVLFYLLVFVGLVSTCTVFADDSSEKSGGSADPAAVERSRAISTARSLCVDYFQKKNQTMGAEVKCSVNLDSPVAVDGWPGRWRMHGLATLRHYKDPASDRSLASREDAIRGNKTLSAKQIRSQIENLYFISSEIVEFEVEVSKLDSSPEIDVTLR